MGRKLGGVLALILGLIATSVAAGLYGYVYDAYALDWPKWIRALIFCLILIPLIVGADKFYGAYKDGDES